MGAGLRAGVHGRVICTHISVILLSLHPAVTFDERLQLVQDVGIANAIRRRRVVAQLRAVRSRYALQAANP